MADKAKIQILEGPDKGEISVMFNPREYSITQEVKKTGKSSKMQFNVVDMPEFTVPLFYDTYEKQSDVRDETKKITSLVMPKVEGKKTKRPPVCLFIWGGFSYRGIVSKVVQKFTMFLDTGIPVRATLTVTFSSILIKEEDETLNPKSSSRKLMIVKSDDRLDLIAYRELKDAALWRKIAEENKIRNPLAFPTEQDIGRILVIPD